MQPSNQKICAGLSLIELLLALAVIAVLSGLASSGLSATIATTRTHNDLNRLLGALAQTRSTALTTGNDAVLCPSTDGKSCADSDRWDGGWIVFQPARGSDHNPQDPIVLRQGALADGTHIVSTRGRTHIRFQPTGSNAGSNVTFTFCDRRGAQAASAYVMSNTGRLHVAKPEADNVAVACGG